MRDIGKRTGTTPGAGNTEIDKLARAVGVGDVGGLSPVSAERKSLDERNAARKKRATARTPFTEGESLG